MLWGRSNGLEGSEEGAGASQRMKRLQTLALSA